MGIQFAYIIMKIRPRNMQETGQRKMTKCDKLKLQSFDNFLIFAQKIDCRYTFETPLRGSSNAYTQPIFLAHNIRKIMHALITPILLYNLSGV